METLQQMVKTHRIPCQKHSKMNYRKNPRHKMLKQSPEKTMLSNQIDDLARFHKTAISLQPEQQIACCKDITPKNLHTTILYETIIFPTPMQLISHKTA